MTPTLGHGTIETAIKAYWRASDNPWGINADVLTRKLFNVLGTSAGIPRNEIWVIKDGRVVLRQRVTDA